jgi:hypothetical protein
MAGQFAPERGEGGYADAKLAAAIDHVKLLSHGLDIDPETGKRLRHFIDVMP